MDDEESKELREDLLHVLAQIEKLVEKLVNNDVETRQPTTEFQRRLVGEKNAALNDLAEAKHTAQTTTDMNILTDVLTWALTRLEEEEGKVRARQRNKTPTRNNTPKNAHTHDRKNTGSTTPSSASSRPHEQSYITGNQNNTISNSSSKSNNNNNNNNNHHQNEQKIIMDHKYPELIMGHTGWTIHAAPNGKAYWFHEDTERSVWEEPDNVLEYRKQTEVDGWGVHPSPKGKPYWHNELTGESVWVEPNKMKDSRLAYIERVQHEAGTKTASGPRGGGSSKTKNVSDDDSAEDLSSDEDMFQSLAESKRSKRSKKRKKGGKRVTGMSDNSDKILNDTMKELEKAYTTIHELNEDRDALVEALEKLSVESEDIIHDLKMQLKKANKKINKMKQNGRNDRGESKNKHADEETMEELQTGLESALEELQTEIERNDGLANENDDLRNELDRIKREHAKVASSSSPPKIPSSPKFALSDAESLVLAGNSASLLQKRMRGFLARKEFEKRLDDHIDEDIVIPDFSHLNARASDRNSNHRGSSKYSESDDGGGGGRYTNDGYGRRR
tara:strand:+ start:178 stop:1857 length:1680 start_codon:yes stop_codon:yes gene_type:complete